MKLLTVITPDRGAFDKVRTANGSRAIDIVVERFIQTSTRPQNIGRSVKLGLATPLSLGHNLKTGGFASSSFDEFAHVTGGNMVTHLRREQ